MTKKKYTLVLDLDQTIISGEEISKHDELRKSDISILEKEKKMVYHTLSDNYYIFERPYLQIFLDFIFKNFNVIVWTAASKDYALFIIDNVILSPKSKPKRCIDWIFIVYHCEISESYYDGLKKLTLLYEKFNLPHLTKDNTFIIDDNENVHEIQPTKTVHIPPFNFTDKNSENEKVLLDLQRELELLLSNSPKSVDTTSITENLKKSVSL